MPQHNGTGHRTHPVVARLAATVREDLPTLAERFAEQMVVVEPVYLDRFDDAERLTACTQNLEALLAALVTGGENLDPRPHETTGRRNAEMEVPLQSLLHLYRLAAQVVWRELIDACADDPDCRDALLEGATGVWEILDLQSAMVADAYTASQLRFGQVRAAKRSAAVSTLLAGGDGDRHAARNAAVSLGMGDGPLLVAAHVTLPSQDRHVVESALGARGIRSVWQVRGDVTVGVAVATGLPSGMTLPVTVAVEPGLRDVTDVPTSLELALLALRACAGGPTGDEALGAGRLVGLAEHLPQALLLRSPDLAERIVQEVLGDPTTWRISHSDLVQTMRTWYGCGGDASRTAALLYCHRNTVFNRLRRLQELTGRSLSDPADVTALVLAVEALRLDLARAPA
ncbi:MAG TPA: helix-turn-helix domain-containing protein [Euzebya sp.]|nr:helix-turn-helix domain-containing protein [Euzebya sp.]